MWIVRLARLKYFSDERADRRVPVLVYLKCRSSSRGFFMLLSMVGLRCKTSDYEKHIDSSLCRHNYFM